MENGKSELDHGFWAVVTTQSYKYVGVIDGADNYDHVEAQLKEANGWLALSPVYELTMMTLPRQNPDGSVEIQRQINIVPLAANSRKQTIRCRPDSIWPFSDMDSDDVKQYWGMVETAIKLSEMQRVAQSGLVPPPRGFRPPPGGMPKF